MSTTEIIHHASSVGLHNSARSWLELNRDCSSLGVCSLRPPSAAAGHPGSRRRSSPLTAALGPAHLIAPDRGCTAEEHQRATRAPAPIPQALLGSGRCGARAPVRGPNGAWRGGGRSHKPGAGVLILRRWRCRRARVRDGARSPLGRCASLRWRAAGCARRAASSSSTLARSRRRLERCRRGNRIAPSIPTGDSWGLRTWRGSAGRRAALLLRCRLRSLAGLRVALVWLRRSDGCR